MCGITGIFSEIWSPAQAWRGGVHSPGLYRHPAPGAPYRSWGLYGRRSYGYCLPSFNTICRLQQNPIRENSEGLPRFWTWGSSRSFWWNISIHEQAIMSKTALYTAMQPLFGERVYNGGKRCNHKRFRRASNSHDVYSRAVCITGIRMDCSRTRLWTTLQISCHRSLCETCRLRKACLWRRGCKSGN